MITAEDTQPLRTGRKAITALFPYAVWQDRDGHHEMLAIFLRAARASNYTGFVWHHVQPFVDTLLSKADPRTILLASPHVPWDSWIGRQDLIQPWTAAVHKVPYTEEVGQSVVDTLLQIASEDELLPQIDVDAWSWLKKRPPLPPACLGRVFGSYSHVVKAVRGLKDAEVLKSYLLLVWSEWDSLWPHGFDEMCASIREDFSKIGMGHHRAELIQRLDKVLERLDLGFGYLNQYNPYLEEHDLAVMQVQYTTLKAILLEIDEERKLTGAYPELSIHFGLLILVHAQSTTQPLCVRCLYASDGLGSMVFIFCSRSWGSSHWPVEGRASRWD